MTYFLTSAAALAFLIGVAHTLLGERYIVTRLLRRSDLPELFGADTFTRQTIRFAWHLTTVAWWGLASILVAVSGVFEGVLVRNAVVSSIAFTFLASAILSIVFTRGKHLSWLVFVAIAFLCWLAVK